MDLSLFISFVLLLIGLGLLSSQFLGKKRTIILSFPFAVVGYIVYLAYNFLTCPTSSFSIFACFDFGNGPLAWPLAYVPVSIIIFVPLGALLNKILHKRYKSENSQIKTKKQTKAIWKSWYYTVLSIPGIFVTILLLVLILNIPRLILYAKFEWGQPSLKQAFLYKVPEIRSFDKTALSNNSTVTISSISFNSPWGKETSSNANQIGPTTDLTFVSGQKINVDITKDANLMDLQYVQQLPFEYSPFELAQMWRGEAPNTTVYFDYNGDVYQSVYITTPKDISFFEPLDEINSIYHLLLIKENPRFVFNPSLDLNFSCNNCNVPLYQLHQNWGLDGFQWGQPGKDKSITIRIFDKNNIYLLTLSGPNITQKDIDSIFSSFKSN